MEISEFKTKYARVLEVIEEGRLERALSMLRRLVEWNNLPDSYLREVNNLQGKFFYMLRYMIDNPGHDDGEQDLFTIKKAVLRLARDIEQEFFCLNDSREYYARVRFRKLRPEETLESLYADYLDESARLAKDSAALMDTSRRARLEQISDSIFGIIWTDIHLDSETREIISALITDTGLPAYDRALWTSAVGLGMFHGWCEERMSFLMEIINLEAGEISNIAFVWFCLAFFTYFNVEEFQETVSYLGFSFDSELYKRLYTLAVLLARQLGAPALAARFSSAELSGLNSVGRSFAMDVNADADPVKAAEKAMSELPEGSFDKIKDFTEAVRNGYDVFYNSLGKMRNYDFFRKTSNWLLPFHADHSALASVVDTEGLAIAEMMEKMRALADSDKFSLLLSIAQAPESVRTNMLQSMTAPIMAMMDDPDMEQIYNDEKAPALNVFFSNYLKNLYRFFTVGPGRELPYNPFNITAEGKEQKRSSYFSPLIMYLSEQRRLPDNWFELPRVLVESGYKDAAAGFISSVEFLDYHPEDFESAVLVAQLALETDMPVFEDWSLEQFRDSHQSDNRFLELMGRLSVRNFNFSEALALLLQLEYQLPEGKMSDEAELALISAMGGTGDYSGALERLDKLELRSSVNALSLILRGVLLWEDGKRRAALDCFEKALALKTFSEQEFYKKVYETYLHSHPVSLTDSLTSVLPSILELSKGTTRFGKI